MRLVTILLPTQVPADHAPLSWSDFCLAPARVETFAQGLISDAQFTVLRHDDGRTLLLLIGMAFTFTFTKATFSFGHGVRWLGVRRCGWFTLHGLIRQRREMQQDLNFGMTCEPLECNVEWLWLPGRRG